MSIAFFDMDGTIVDGDTNELTISYFIKQGIADQSSMQKFKQYQEEFFKGTVDINECIKFFASLLVKLDAKKLDEIIGGAVKENVLPRVKKGALKAIEFHKKRNDKILIVTSTSDYIAGRLAKFLGISDVIAAPMEMIDGRITGNTCGIVPFQQDKVVRINNYLKDNKLDLKDSYAYGDSVNDLQMLMLCEHRFAVDPNEKLLKDPLIKELEIVYWD